MRLSCLVNNFNYDRYVAEAVDSALAQSLPFAEVIVVDDGSTDRSSDVLAALEARHRRLRVLRKENGGQLSAFATGFAESTGDVVFFLDADDVYREDYAEWMADVFRRRADVGYACCGRRLFGRVNRIERQFAGDTDLGYSAAGLAVGGLWFGGSTSCVAMRRDTLARLLPAPELEATWTINADLCLAYGASLAGTRKYCVPEPLVSYRVHSRNAYFGRPEDAAGKYLRRLRSAGLVQHYLRRFDLSRARLSELLHLEFATIPRPDKTMLKRYMRTALAGEGPALRRAWQARRIWGHYRESRRINAPAAGCAGSSPAPRLYVTGRAA